MSTTATMSTFDWGTLIGAGGLVLAIIGAIIRNAVALSAAAATAQASIRRSDKTAEDFNEYRVIAAGTFASNASLKLVEDRVVAAISTLGHQFEKLTDRLDRLIQNNVGPSK